MRLRVLCPLTRNLGTSDVSCLPPNVWPHESLGQSKRGPLGDAVERLGHRQSLLSYHMSVLSALRHFLKIASSSKFAMKSPRP